MSKVAGHIIKADNVKLQGQFYLDVTQLQPSLPKKKTTVLSSPQVRIVENRPEFAVIEVTCCCGQKTYLRCEYAGIQPAKNPQVQNGAFTVSEQNPDKTK